MATMRTTLRGDFSTVLRAIEESILQGSMSASLEGSEDFRTENVRCAVRVFERYSAFGGNRVSLNVTLLEADGQLFLTGISAGGSQAVLFKMNTLGEDAFLDCLREAVQRFDGR